MSELQVSRWTDLLRRLCGLAGEPGPSLPEVEDSLTPVMVMEGERPEHQYLKGERLCFANVVNQSPAVGRWVVGQLLNPVDSGVLIIPDAVNLWTNGGDSGQCFLSAPGPIVALANNMGPRFRDTRLQSPVTPTQPTGRATFATDVNLAALPFPYIVYYRFNQVSAVSHLLAPVVLRPGDALSIAPFAVDVPGVAITFAWRERTIEQSER